MKYQVFARLNAGDDTQHIGEVDASSDRLAKIYAIQTYDEEDWDYLAVVREEHLLEVEDRNVATQRGESA
ncbi:MAG: phenylacetic acid degradation PaaB family protein [Halobacteriales archaeon]